jgi:hypothetical protein
MPTTGNETPAVEAGAFLRNASASLLTPPFGSDLRFMNKGSCSPSAPPRSTGWLGSSVVASLDRQRILPDYAAASMGNLGIGDIPRLFPV